MVEKKVLIQAASLDDCSVDVWDKQKACAVVGSWASNLVYFEVVKTVLRMVVYWAVRLGNG